MKFPLQDLRAKLCCENWRSLWFGILSLIVLFIALRWNNFDAPLIRDEGEYAYAAQLLEHGMAPYEHAFIQKPPMVFYSYALSDFFLPHVFWAPRILACVFTALATVLLGIIAKLEFGKGFALPTMWVATPMVLMPEIEQFTANTETFMLLPLLATVAIYSYSRQHGHKSKHWFAAGCFGVTTLLYKYTAAPVLIFVFAVWSIEMWRASRDVKFFSLCWFSALMGGGIATVAILGFFLLHDGGAGLWECTVLFNRYYASSSNFGLASFESRLGELFSAWWILFLLPCAIFFKPKQRIWFWGGVIVCAVLATNASCYGQYYIIMMPFWAMLSAAGICVLAERTSQWLARPARWIFLMLFTLTMLLELKPDVPWLICSRERFARAKMSGTPFMQSQLMAKKIDELSLQNNAIFIAGSEPQIFCYAQRASLTRFITVYSLMIPTPVALNYQQEAIRDLQEHPPSLIVFVQVSTSWLRQETTPPDFLNFLNSFLKQDYDLVGGYVTDGQKNRWSEPLTNYEFANSSFLLYKHKN